MPLTPTNIPSPLPSVEALEGIRMEKGGRGIRNIQLKGTPARESFCCRNNLHVPIIVQEETRSVTTRTITGGDLC